MVEGVVKGQRYANAVFWRISDCSVVGLFEADDPVGVTSCRPGPTASRAARTGGLAHLQDGREAWVVGRESLRLLFIEHVHGAFDASAGERAFLADWRAPRSPARQQALEGAYRKLVPRERIAHEISNSVPGIRLWPSDPPVADYIAVGEVRLRAGFKNFRLGGIFL